MYSIIKYVPASLAHHLAPLGLRIYSDICGVADTPEWKPFNWKGLHFSNRLGIAGGVDKDGENISSWKNLGCGFVEIGTVTPKPQKSNPGKIVDRDWDQSNLWNKMGFPSQGAREVSMNLLHERSSIPILVNIGKNRETLNENAIDDYLENIDVLKSMASAFVVNVSSPNTKGLRDLQSKEVLSQLTAAVIKKSGNTPVLLKLSPDLSEDQLHEAIEAGVNSHIDGFVLTNTTTFRPESSRFPKEGGLAGKDLAQKSKVFLKETQRALGTSRQGLLLISVGGVLTEKDVHERLDLGADLVEVYSALVFRGPRFFRDVAESFQRAEVQ